MSLDSTQHSIDIRRGPGVVLVGGGTAGHVSPALAIAEALQQSFDAIDLCFIGTAEGIESRLVPSSGYRLETVHGAPLYRVGWGEKLRAVWSLCRGIIQARRVLRSSGAKLVIGFGGYVTAGTLLAAWSLGLRTAIHEANILPGLTNKLLGRFVDRVYLGFETAAGSFPKGRTLVSGNPIRQDIASLIGQEREAPRADSRPLHILVTGGSEASLFLNENVPAVLQRVAQRGLELEVRHQVGEFDLKSVQAAYANAGITAKVDSYISDMSEAYRWADFAITRGGAITIAELAATGLPALLVPLPNAAGDHQAVNAWAVEKAGGGWWVREAHWHDDEVADRMTAFLTNREAWQMASNNVRRLAAPDAAQKLVADCKLLMTRKG